LLNFLGEVVGHPTCCSTFVKGLVCPTTSFRINNDREVDWREAEPNKCIIEIRFKPIIAKQFDIVIGYGMPPKFTIPYKLRIARAEARKEFS
jgi:hypothetical protein